MFRNGGNDEEARHMGDIECKVKVVVSRVRDTES